MYASIFDCVEPILTIATALGGKTPFQSPLDKREEASAAHQAYCSRSMKQHNHKLTVPYPDDSARHHFPYSDHIAVIRAFDIWYHVLRTEGSKAAYVYCRDNFLSSSGMEEIRDLRDQLRAYLRDGHLLSDRTAVLTDEEGGSM